MLPAADSQKAPIQVTLSSNLRRPKNTTFHQLPRNRCRPNRLTGSSSSLRVVACFSTNQSDADCSAFRGIHTAGNTQLGGVQLLPGTRAAVCSEGVEVRQELVQTNDLLGRGMYAEPVE
eukprot:GHRR01006567.1.p3 GENE.GHRR01006567.1~~GHRR01006567.1.p3  ORF type:complete len:119 (-),score=19.48 GHRR01006567.1:430-786(-)